MKDILNGKKAIIFDLDGTLVDSMWMWKSIDIEFLGRYGHECPPELQRAIEGMSFSETAIYFKERFRIPLTLEEIKNTWITMSIDKYRYEVSPKKGTMEFLAYVRDMGIVCGIATSNSREMVDTVIEALGMKPYFQAVVTACEVKAGKPEPDIYLKVAQDLEVEPKDCLVFEDVPAGILAGRRAGMEVCAVDDEFSKHMEQEKRELADYFIRDYFDILDGELL